MFHIVKEKRLKVSCTLDLSRFWNRFESGYIFRRSHDLECIIRVATKIVRGGNDDGKYARESNGL